MDRRFTSKFQSWITSYPDAIDPDQDEQLESFFSSLVQDSDGATTKVREGLDDITRRILTREIHPSSRQKTRFWFYVAQSSVAANFYGKAFEALMMCEQELAENDKEALIEVHTLLTHVSLKQGHFAQAYMSSLVTASALQSMLPKLRGMVPPALSEESATALPVDSVNQLLLGQRDA